MGKCNTDPSREHFTQGIISFLPVPLHFLLQSILVLSQITTEIMFNWKKERKKIFCFKTLHSCCVLHTVWMIGGARRGGHVQRLDHVICLNQWLHTSEWKKTWSYSRCVWAEADATSVDVTFLPKQRFDVAVATGRPPHPPPPLSSSLRSLLSTATQQTKATQILSLHLL